jgi:hypothetical protein
MSAPKAQMTGATGVQTPFNLSSSFLPRPCAHRCRFQHKLEGPSQARKQRQMVQVAAVLAADAPPLVRPDANGRYGRFGGKYVPETLIGALTELEVAYAEASKDEEFLVCVFYSGGLSGALAAKAALPLCCMQPCVDNLPAHWNSFPSQTGHAPAIVIWEGGCAHLGAWVGHTHLVSRWTHVLFSKVRF